MPGRCLYPGLVPVGQRNRKPKPPPRPPYWPPITRPSALEDCRTVLLRQVVRQCKRRRARNYALRENQGSSASPQTLLPPFKNCPTPNARPWCWWISSASGAPRRPPSWAARWGPCSSTWRRAEERSEANKMKINALFMTLLTLFLVGCTSDSTPHLGACSVRCPNPPGL